MEDRCQWKSEVNAHSCGNPQFENSEFCIFHKPQKNEREARLFWRLVNWNSKAKDLIKQISKENNEAYKCEETERNQKWSNIAKLIEPIKNSNFTISELQNRVFYNYIIDLQEKNKIWIPNINRADFSGFVFPLFSEPFNYAVHLFKYQERTYFDFSDSVFEGEAIFSGYIFNSEVNFKRISLNISMLFLNSQFLTNVTFEDFNIYGICGYHGINPFDNAHFDGERVIFSNIKNLNLYNTYFSKKTNIQIINLSFDFSQSEFALKTYRTLKQHYNILGEYGFAAKYNNELIKSEPMYLLTTISLFGFAFEEIKNAILEKADFYHIEKDKRLFFHALKTEIQKEQSIAIQENNYNEVDPNIFEKTLSFIEQNLFLSNTEQLYDSKIEQIYDSNKKILSEVKEMRVENRENKVEIIAAVTNLTETQTQLLWTDIAAFFFEFESAMDEKLLEQVQQIKSASSLKSKLELSLPFIKMLGVDYKIEFDVVGWANKMYAKHELKIFKIMGMV